MHEAAATPQSAAAAHDEAPRGVFRDLATRLRDGVRAQGGRLFGGRDILIRFHCDDEALEMRYQGKPDAMTLRSCHIDTPSPRKPDSIITVRRGAVEGLQSGSLSPMAAWGRGDLRAQGPMALTTAVGELLMGGASKSKL